MISLRFPLHSLLIFLVICLISSPQLHADSLQTYKIGGTGGALATMRLLVKEYQQNHPEIRIQVFPSLGTTGGVRALADNALDLGLAARQLTPEEKAHSLTCRPYAKTPIVFATSRCNTVNELTSADIAAILSGKVRYWPDGEYIRLVMRSLSESDFAPLSSKSDQLRIALEHAAQRTDTVFAPTAQDNAHILESLPHSFGITSLAQIISESMAVKPIVYNGLAPTAVNLQNGSYPFEKTYALVYKDEDLPNDLERFITFLFSREACQILEETGHTCIEGR